MKYKKLVYAESFTAGGQEFVPRRIPAFSRAHVLTPYSLSITVDLNLVSKQNSQRWTKTLYYITPDRPHGAQHYVYFIAGFGVLIQICFLISFGVGGQ